MYDSSVLLHRALSTLRFLPPTHVSAFETYAFLWRRGDDGATGVNHDASFRPRRQDREPHFQETGAFYVLDVAGFRRAGFRFFGRIGVEEVAADRALEIDSPDELRLARLLAPALAPAPAAVPAKALVTDFDGVHTDDTAALDQEGRESVRVSRSDGMGVERLRRAGVPVLILSKERNPVVAARGAKLRVPVLQGVEDKAAALTAWLAEQGVEPADCAYVGNDVNDLTAMALVGWPIAVADAHPDVVTAARTVLRRRGGHGAVREAAELLLAAQEEEA